MIVANPILQIGAASLIIVIGLATLSFWFPDGVSVTDTPLTLYVTLALLAGAIWAWLPRQIRQARGASQSVLAIVLIGLAMRGAMFVSAPVLEDDSYRYLWDGAVTARGIDPYKYAPAEVTSNPVLGAAFSDENSAALGELKKLALENGEPYSRINYPFVSTIYPPLAQAAFAVAHWIDPFGLTGWRLVLLAADLVTLGLLLKLLRDLNRAAIWVSLYWLNPVVLLQGFGAGHMDLLLPPFLLGALLFARSGRILSAAFVLVGGAAIKLWPAMLFPLFARPLLRQPLKLCLVALAFVASLLFVLSPQLFHALRPEAGLNAYASDWRTHAFAFAILEDVVFFFMDDSGRAARIAVALAIISVTGYLSLRFATETDRLPSLLAGVIAALIFLSPTGYPWYFLWLAPFLPFVPHAGLIALFVLAPLYWLRFALGDESSVYQWGVVPVAFGIPLLLILQTYFRRSFHDAVGHHNPSAE